MNMQDSIPHIIQLLRTAGSRILEVYRSGIEGAQVEWKEDQSPLTLADKRSHEYLSEQLVILDDTIPIMSEESIQLHYDERKTWTRYWCLDPLDGTKEFIKRNDQFTINLALMEDAQPVLSFIHVPVSGFTYWAAKGRGSFLNDGTEENSIQANRKTEGWIAVGSSSHGSGREEEFLKRFPITQVITAGSALKFCYIASGRADVYFREGPTMEWDTAAGHLLVEEAGAQFHYLTDSLSYYNKESLLNSSFVVHLPL